MQLTIQLLKEHSQHLGRSRFDEIIRWDSEFWKVLAYAIYNSVWDGSPMTSIMSTTVVIHRKDHVVLAINVKVILSRVNMCPMMHCRVWTADRNTSVLSLSKHGRLW